MTRRLTLAELDYRILEEILDDDVWTTPTQIVRALGLGGNDHYRVALVCERLVVDGHAEIKRAGSTVRRFRRASI